MTETASDNLADFLPRRRQMLAGTLAGSLAALFGAGPAQADDVVLADPKAYPTAAFAQKTEADALKAMFGRTATVSPKISLDAPDIAENGAVVPIAVKTDLPDVTAIAILALDNPFTISAAYRIPPGTAAAVSSRIKLAKTTTVLAVVEAGGQLYSASRSVKVTLGGCGG
ncbi:MAG: thiosulfate oxidation carrier protein SoxY [Proteobacteria bacterium]|nr:thiosulfate oxidation carrier protein SoxY [Pseudomonadota bacterium]